MDENRPTLSPCPGCERPVSRWAAFCPGCGHPFPENAPPSHHPLRGYPLVPEDLDPSDRTRIWQEENVKGLGIVLMGMFLSLVTAFIPAWLYQAVMALFRLPARNDELVYWGGYVVALSLYFIGYYCYEQRRRSRRRRPDR